MKKLNALLLFMFLLVGIVISSYAAGPSDDRAKGAYKMILSGADGDKDGKLSISECKSIYKDPSMADKNCDYWDSNKDGIITEDEYVKQGMSIGKK